MKECGETDGELPPKMLSTTQLDSFYDILGWPLKGLLLYFWLMLSLEWVLL
jgi:hypothetical protein